MSPILRSDTSSSNQELAFGLVGTVLALVAVVVATLQYRRMCQKDKDDRLLYEMDAVESQVR
jgi:hypothetical protein